MYQRRRSLRREFHVRNAFVFSTSTPRPRGVTNRASPCSALTDSDQQQVRKAPDDRRAEVTGRMMLRSSMDRGEIGGSTAFPEAHPTVAGRARRPSGVNARTDTWGHAPGDRQRDAGGPRGARRGQLPVFEGEPGTSAAWWRRRRPTSARRPKIGSVLTTCSGSRIDAWKDGETDHWQRDRGKRPHDADDGGQPAPALVRLRHRASPVYRRNAESGSRCRPLPGGLNRGVIATKWSSGVWIGAQTGAERCDLARPRQWSKVKDQSSDHAICLLIRAEL